MRNKNSLFWEYGEGSIDEWNTIAARRHRIFRFSQFRSFGEWETIPSSMEKEFNFKKYK